VTTKILHRLLPQRLHLRAAGISTDYIESYPPPIRSYYPRDGGLRATIKRMIEDFDWQRPFTDLDRDVDYVMRAARKCTSAANGRDGSQLPDPGAVLGLLPQQGRLHHRQGDQRPPGIPVRDPGAARQRGLLYLDTILLDPWRISVLFSLSRAYFMVDMEVPSGYVQFLRTIMPNKPRSELYTMLGLGKQGKTMFFRDLIAHLRTPNDQFIDRTRHPRPGDAGVHAALLSLRVQDHQGRLRQLEGHGPRHREAQVPDGQAGRPRRAHGRHAGVLRRRAAAGALPTPELLEELRELAPSMFEEDGDTLVIKHLYIERRMVPLNLYLERRATPDRARGRRVRQRHPRTGVANIFPGDMLWKNFGVTRYGRVVFYDYDEIEYMTDCNFRQIRKPAATRTRCRASLVFGGRNDVFPEEFATFLLGSPKVRQAFMKHHKYLLTQEFWQQTKGRSRTARSRTSSPIRKKCVSATPSPSRPQARCQRHSLRNPRNSETRCYTFA
jgi:isocitrate dehydrogenase kinase/phosphatase